MDLEGKTGDLHAWVFAVIRGGYSRGIRGYSRAFAPLMLVFDAKGLYAEIEISPQFHDSFARWDSPETIRQKPEILVEQTLYIILILKSDIGLALDACA